MAGGLREREEMGGKDVKFIRGKFYLVYKFILM